MQCSLAETMASINLVEETHLPITGTLEELEARQSSF